MAQVLTLLGSIAPRIIIPGFFIGQKVKGMDDYGKIFQTIAFSAFFVATVLTLFRQDGGDVWLAIIPGIAGLSYYYMMNDPINKQKYRYADWLITTPLMLIAILLANKQPLGLIAALAALDLEMIGFGYAGVAQQDIKKKMTAFALGCLAFLPILYYLAKQKKYGFAVYLTLFLWCLYPIVWYNEELKTVSETVITGSYAVMDVTAKIGLVYLLNG
jgi:bacteriorhodopsin